MKHLRTVHFPIHPVTGISRWPSTRELTALYNLEDHIDYCGTCGGAFHFGHFHRLCARGFDCADAVVYLMYGGNGKAYSTAFPTTRFVQIEVPLGCRAASRLLNLYTKPGRQLRRGWQREDHVVGRHCRA